MANPQEWFRELQQQLLDGVGEPVFLTLRMTFDEWFEVEVRTFSARRGTAAGNDVVQAIEEAVQMLLEMDDVVAEVKRRSGARW